MFAINVGIFVAAAGEIDDEQLSRGGGGAPNRFGYGVGGFERRDDSFGAGELHRGRESRGVADGSVLGAMLIVKPGVLGTDQRVIEPGGNGMGERDLAVGIL